MKGMVLNMLTAQQMISELERKIKIHYDLMKKYQNKAKEDNYWNSTAKDFQTQYELLVEIYEDFTDTPYEHKGE